MWVKRENGVGETLYFYKCFFLYLNVSSKEERTLADDAPWMVDLNRRNLLSLIGERRKNSPISILIFQSGEEEEAEFPKMLVEPILMLPHLFSGSLRLYLGTVRTLRISNPHWLTG